MNASLVVATTACVLLLVPTMVTVRDLPPAWALAAGGLGLAWCVALVAVAGRGRQRAGRLLASLVAEQGFRTRARADLRARMDAGERLTSPEVERSLDELAVNGLDDLSRLHDRAFAIGFAGSLVSIVVQVLLAHVHGAATGALLVGTLLAVTKTAQGLVAAGYVAWLHRALLAHARAIARELLDEQRRDHREHFAALAEGRIANELERAVEAATAQFRQALGAAVDDASARFADALGTATRRSSTELGGALAATVDRLSAEARRVLDGDLKTAVEGALVQPVQGLATQLGAASARTIDTMAQASTHIATELSEILLEATRAQTAAGEKAAMAASALSAQIERLLARPDTLCDALREADVKARELVDTVGSSVREAQEAAALLADNVVQLAAHQPAPARGFHTHLDELREGQARGLESQHRIEAALVNLSDAVVSFRDVAGEPFAPLIARNGSQS